MIKLTLDNGSPIYINANQVQTVEVYGLKTTVYIHGQTFYVKESIDQVVKKLEIVLTTRGEK